MAPVKHRTSPFLCVVHTKTYFSVVVILGQLSFVQMEFSRMTSELSSSAVCLARSQAAPAREGKMTARTAGVHTAMITRPG